MDTALTPLLSSTSSAFQDLADTVCNVSLRYIGPFSFVLLYDFLQEVLQNVTDPQQCPYLITQNGITSLTNDACHILTGSNKWTWWMYSLIGVWNRIVTWKLPLVVLLFHFARPPLPSRWLTSTTVFILAHLLADPIHTTASLIYTVYQCQELTKEVRKYVDNARKRAREQGVETWRVKLGGDNLWKELGVIGATYSEWGVKDIDVFLQETLDRLLSPTTSPSQALRIMHHIRLSASLLAADRSTYVLPIFITLLSFIIGIAGAYWRVADVKAQASDGNTWLNIEAYSIAISAPFLHLIPAIFLSALIGVPQTETSHPNILNDFHDKLEKEGEEWTRGLKRIETPVVLSKRRNFSSASVLGLEGKEEDDEEKGTKEGKEEREDNGDMISSDLHHRISSGGMYAYRPELFSPSHLSATLPHIALSFFFVFTSFLVASFIAYRVPPEGFDCRNASLVMIMGVWFLSAASDFLLTVIRELSSSSSTPTRPSSPLSLISPPSSSTSSPYSSASPFPSFSPYSLTPSSSSLPSSFPSSSSPPSYSSIPSFPGLPASPLTPSSPSPLLPSPPRSTKPPSSPSFPSSPGTPSTPTGGKISTYHPTLLKNLLLSSFIFTIILLIQLGIFNRCDCYSLWGWAPLGLPQIPAIEQILVRHIRGKWPAVTFGWVGLEMIICAGVVWRYKDAFRVYLQRDDGGSNGEGIPGFIAQGIACVGDGWMQVWRGTVRVGRRWIRRWLRGRQAGGGQGFVEVVTIEGVEHLESPVIEKMTDKVDVKFLELGSETWKEVSLADDVEIRAFTGD